MQARDLVSDFPTVGMDLPAVEAARLLTAQNLPGLIVGGSGGSGSRPSSNRTPACWRSRR